jgi:hypothetical protein
MFNAQARAAEEGHDGPADAAGLGRVEALTLVTADRVRTGFGASTGRAAPGFVSRGVREFFITAV